MTRVLVVDDSSFMRKALTHIIGTDDALQVAGTAADGAEALQKIAELQPDVVLLDIDMPVIDGFTTLLRIMGERPMPVVMLSGLDSRHANIAIKSLEYGAIDFIAKPSGVISYDIEKIRDEIIQKLKMAAGVSIRGGATGLPPPPAAIPVPMQVAGESNIVVIGASTGGLVAIATVLSGLSRNLPATVLVVQHLAPEFMPAYVDRLRWTTYLDVSIAEKDEPLEPGRVLVAPGGCHTIIKGGKRKQIAFRETGTPDLSLPSIDLAMESAAAAYGGGTIGVILTGLGTDGVDGVRAIKAAGGKTIAQDRATSIVYGMPKASVEAGHIDVSAPLGRIAGEIMRMMAGQRHPLELDLSIFLGEFVADAKEGLGKIGVVLPVLEKEPDHPGSLEAISDVFHTLKGESETIGFNEIAALSFWSMAFVNGIRKKEYLAADGTAGILKQIAALLEAMISARERGGAIKAWHGRLDELRREMDTMKADGTGGEHAG